MRIRTTLVTGALLLASTFATAQQAQQTPQITPQPGPTTDAVASPGGSFDFGFRAGSFDGDRARFARYQDFRDKQAGINFRWSKEGPSWFAKLGANNVGYNDQNFGGAFATGKLKGSFEWNQTPLFYGAPDVLKSPYSPASISGGVATLTLDAATRQAIQSGTNVTSGVQSISALGVATSVAQATSGTLWRNLAQGVDVRSRRDEAKFDLTYEANRDVDVKFSLNSYRRNGTQPWGASFAFNDAVELPLPIDNRTTDLKAEAEWANQKGMLRVGYDGSYFNNNITTLVWSNPVRATDGWAGSSYSNALLGGSALGRMALAPNNTANTVSAAGLYKLPGRSSFNASLAISSLKQDDALLPFTINSTLQPGARVTVSGATWTLVAPERATAQADVRLTVGNFNFTTRPTRYFGLTAKYRYSNWDNRTPIFHNQFNVRFDGAPENVPGSETEPGNIKAQTFDVDASFTPVTYGAFRLGYGRNASDLTYRMFTGTTENTFRVAFDTIGNQYVTLRAKYESSKRDGLNIGDLTLRDGEVEDYFTAVGQHPGMAQFDIASRNRNRGTLVFDVSPVSAVGLSMSVFRGTDEYPGLQYGLLNNDNTGISFGLDLMPSNFVTVGFNYGYEKYDALQASHNANPAPDPQWTDPTRDWNLNNTERVDTFGANIELVKVIPKTEIRFGYDYSKSDQGFIYGGPRVDALAALTSAYGPQFQPLPNVGNKLQGASIDLRYHITPKIALGANFLHQRYDVTDFSTSGTPANGTAGTYDPIGGLILGYGFRPYNANIGGFRVIYLF